jgi:SAM-dependent methyltransferase
MKKVLEEPFREKVKELAGPERRKEFDELAEVRKGQDPARWFVMEAAGKYLKSGAKVLDIGSGTKNYAVALAGKNISMIPVDFSKVVHDILKEERREKGVDGEQMIADITKLPYRDGSLDGAIFFGTSAFLRREDVKKCLSEVMRVLKEGGILIAAFPSTASEVYARSKSRDDSSKTIKVDSELTLGDAPINFFDKDDFQEYVKLLKGFKIREVYHGSTMVPTGGAEYLLHWDWYLVAEKKS